MVLTVNDLSKWENFPKGLKVLLLLRENSGDENSGGGGGGGDFSAVETQSMLESMDYIVTTFTDESEALSAVIKNPESFHIAIVEVNTIADDESFKFLEAAKDLLPTIAFSAVHCITTTMKCIKLGAVEFLQKPLSSDKLMNIWQHVVHKAFNDSESNTKESDALMLQLDTDMMITDEQDTAPSTPQLKQVSRLLDEDCQDNVNCSTEIVNSSTEKENSEDQENVGESKLVDTTNDDKVVVKEEKGETEKGEDEEGETGDLKSQKINLPVNCHSKKVNKHVNRSSGNKNSSGNRSRKKVDWTQDLHKKFVQAVEQLGLDHAIPSRILEVMKVDGLTRHNVASHLQKYRMHRRNILPKADHHHNNQRWVQTRENHRQIQRNFNSFQQQQRPVMAYPVWGVPGVHPPGAVPPLWPPPLPQASGHQPPWHWKPPYPPVTGNAWGCPVGPPVTGSPINNPQITNTGGFQYPAGPEFKLTPAIQPQLDEEMIDLVVKEAITKPWLPLPLGLKPPSSDSVLTELSRQGISTVPSSSSSCLINGSHRLR